LRLKPWSSLRVDLLHVNQGVTVSTCNSYTRSPR
jgi:hypothetical protein